MKSYTLTILLAVIYSVAANSHLPGDEGFVPPASLADAAALLPADTAALLPAVSDLSEALPPLAKEFGVEPSVSDSNNREFERHQYTFAQINRLCALLRDCNPG
ncbi:hypothetical protein DAPPUDRAFT_94119 [Daphnia pulex]|uniref:Uncharacterized protein n=1 Tax=Daphnia pulex TaxID=6669 RepID=E9FS65_DAPPU|nr:hypothetical protein DAPPUDRAFT_94119 [Daphnia pulex]|eukprot:EFX89978.1 hypothetical protein DAPPUDRAFT_94119 [Daphnia pulex]